ncbi:hypothetical protein [Halomonas sp. 328]|uniref:hypothetical protein n=1 Tax=Halomonas sp. 328 TaxID=2776704 RepID=UPI0018A79DE8|nr:hypothetical protein [Halomonas sp. 328]MBF8222143.1 hypothetical protein [Halomonas sp. 328]
MSRVRYSGDLIASLEGVIWLGLAWSASLSAWQGNALPSITALCLAGTCLIVSLGHRPLRLMLGRYRIRKRRTEMLMHVIALPLLLAMALAVPFEALVTTLTGAQRLLLFNVLATAGWLMFLLTILTKSVIFEVRHRKNGKR